MRKARKAKPVQMLELAIAALEATEEVRVWPSVTAVVFPRVVVPVDSSSHLQWQRATQEQVLQGNTRTSNAAEVKTGMDEHRPEISMATGGSKATVNPTCRTNSNQRRWEIMPKIPIQMPTRSNPDIECGVR